MNPRQRISSEVISVSAFQSPNHPNFADEDEEYPKSLERLARIQRPPQWPFPTEFAKCQATNSSRQDAFSLGQRFKRSRKEPRRGETFSFASPHRIEEAFFVAMTRLWLKRVGLSNQVDMAWP